jgi:hypothetical protein
VERFHCLKHLWRSVTAKESAPLGRGVDCSGIASSTYLGRVVDDY